MHFVGRDSPVSFYRALRYDFIQTLLLNQRDATLQMETPRVGTLLELEDPLFAPLPQFADQRVCVEFPLVVVLKDRDVESRDLVVGRLLLWHV